MILSDIYGVARMVMRSTVKAKLLLLLATEPEAMTAYKRNENAVRLRIMAECEKLIKPTRRQAVIDKIAADIIADLKKGAIVNYYA